jgi:hypothetical protein
MADKLEVSASNSGRVISIQAGEFGADIAADCELVDVSRAARMLVDRAAGFAASDVVAAFVNARRSGK